MSLDPSHLESAEPALHRFADQVTSVLLIAMVIFSPWAFGGWPKWSIWTMNLGGYLLGLLYFAKRVIRWRSRFRPMRWGGRQPAFIRYGLGIITVLLLAWCLVSAVNARAVVDLDKLVLIEEPHWIDWLPHSYDQPASWFAFWQYLGLAGVFWALRDWVSIATARELSLLNQSASHVLSENREALDERSSLTHHLPDRLNRLLWVLCVNGAAVALVGIISTFDNPSKVLWLLPHETRTGSFFGPFWYRNHGAAFANLVWPVCLGLWLGSSAAQPNNLLATFGRSTNSVLPLCTIVMIAAPFISRSRGGSLIALFLLAVSFSILLFRLRSRRLTLLLASATLLAGVGCGVWLARDALRQRFIRDFYAYPTGIEQSLQAFTICASLQIPSIWDPYSSTFAGLSRSRTRLWDTPGSMTLSLRPNGVFEARFVETDRTRVLALRTTNSLLAETSRMVEVVFVHQAGESALYLNNEPQSLHKVVAQAGFNWPVPLASSYLWVGRGSGASMKFSGRIDRVSFFDLALSAGQFATQMSDRRVRSTNGLESHLRLDLRPDALSFGQWLMEGFGGRRELYQMSRRMMSAYPAVFGSGLGTFASLFKVFLGDSQWTDTWAVHDDFLETRLTLGWAGAALVYAGLAMCLLGCIARGNGAVSSNLVGLVALAITGSLIHARFDWIYQNSALQLTLLVLLGIISTISRNK